MVPYAYPPAKSYQWSMMMVGNNIRVLGTFDDVLGAVQRYRASTVAVSLAGAIGHTAMQNLSWGLEGLDVDMLVAPGVADLRPPTVASRLKLSNAVGLTSALRGDVTIADAAQPSAVAGLDVITSGGIPPNPSELLGSNRTGQFFADLSAIYDYVVVDSPPVLPVTDSIELANWMDGVIVVLRSGKSRIPDLKRVVEQLKMARAQILGLVLNGAKRLDAAYGYYQYDTVEPTEAPVVPVEQPKHAQAQANQRCRLLVTGVAHAW